MPALTIITSNTTYDNISEATAFNSTGFAVEQCESAPSTCKVGACMYIYIYIYIYIHSSRQKSQK